ncbi:MAG: metal-dependent transcriptional regulator [Planctomycetota bacterium]|jgi:DtxR family Mn-dependent transcriptional regulator
MSPFAWWKRLRETRRRVTVEDALKHLHACAWQGYRATTDSLAGGLGLTQRSVIKLCARMQAQGWVQPAEGGWSLTPAGEQLALQVIRAHRLWERYLADEARMPLADVHAEADRREHQRDAETMLALDAAMGHPPLDPHGDPIPSPEGKLLHTDSQPLTEWPTGRPATIVHLEDEPAAIFSQIAAEGLRPGQRIKVIEANGQRIVFSDDAETYVLAPVVAANIFVVAAEPVAVPASIARLNSLKPGRCALVHALDDALRGFTRRRLLDLGLTPGAAIRAEYASFLGDPLAYRVRGSLIALRRDQAEHVLIRADRSGDPA